MAKPLPSLATLEARHKVAVAEGRRSTACTARRAARHIAKAAGIPAPEWAVEMRGPNVQPKQAAPKLGMVADDTPGVCTDIPEALRAWRAAHSRDGAVLHINRKGVHLVTLADRRTFPDVAAAVAAIAS